MDFCNCKVRARHSFAISLFLEGKWNLVHICWFNSCFRREKKSILIPAYLKVSSSIAKFQRSAILSLVL